jgi:hypothetical protein
MAPTGKTSSPSSDGTHTAATMEKKGLPQSDEQLLFPWRLHKMLHDAEIQGNESIVSWLPNNGQGFQVNREKRDEFVAKISKFPLLSTIIVAVFVVTRLPTVLKWAWYYILLNTTFYSRRHDPQTFYIIS